MPKPSKLKKIHLNRALTPNRKADRFSFYYCGEDSRRICDKSLAYSNYNNDAHRMCIDIMNKLAIINGGYKHLKTVRALYAYIDVDR